jgi:hypothetical protein
MMANTRSRILKIKQSKADYRNEFDASFAQVEAIMDPVSTKPALSLLDDAMFLDGTFKYVADSGAYYLDRDSVAVVNGTTVLATQTGVGRWLKDSTALTPSGVDPTYALFSDGANGYLWRAISQDDIAPAFNVSMAGVTSSPLEIGASLINPQFNVTYTSGPATSSSLTDTEANPAQNVLALPNPITRPHTFTKTANNASVTFTVTSFKGLVGPDVSTVAYAWQPRVYWGVGVAGGNTEAFIEALANNSLASGRTRSFTLNPSNEKIYYAVPSGYGACTFTVNGFAGGFNAATVISVTNANGVTQNYDLYESTNLLTGSVPVVVT